MVKIAVKHSLTAIAAHTKLQQLFAKKKYQSKVNHKNSNHESRNNSQAKIKDKEQKIKIKVWIMMH